MAVTFTEDQMKVIETRGSNILVSAAAGSGKTAVLVERIIRMVSEGESPVDIDRLLVVTFTNAAAAEMKERITQALSVQVEKQPDNIHLQKQLTLVHNAQITTIDSFCLYLIRNHFHEIGLDPDFRVADDGEVSLLKQEVMGKLLEERFQEKEEAFLNCVEYFAPTGREKRLEEQILTLYEFAMSYPWPEDWLLEHASDYEIGEEEPAWLELLREHTAIMLREAAQILNEALHICNAPAGPYMYEAALISDLDQVEGMLAHEEPDAWYRAFSMLNFAKLSSKRDENVDTAERERVKALRSEAKDILTGLESRYFAKPLGEQRQRMEACEPAVRMLHTLTLQFKERLDHGKREKGILDFHDMEHLALHILLEKTQDGVRPSQVARTYRSRFAEILIDEYQDSNLVQEYLLQSISGEEDGSFNRFMVGDVKQSIYRFRLARPELFMDKFDRYSKESGPEQRIDLKQNFRSRHQVTERVNRIFDCLMGRDLGGVEYDADAALYPGAVYPEPESQTPAAAGEAGTEDVYKPEMLLSVRRDEEKLDEKEQEALCIADRIRQLAGTLPVFDKETGGLRPARFSDMVILLRTTSGWDETFRKVLMEQGIPVHVTSRTGYFSAPEVQTVLNFLRVLNNPYQDIPLFGVLKSDYCGFTDQDAAWIRAEIGAPGRRLYACMTRYAQEGQRQDLRQRIQTFLNWLENFRRCTVYLPIHKLIERFLESTGCLYTITAMPGGAQRRANVEMLVHKAEDFEKTSYFGLFHFIRYMEQIEKYDIDYGEANIQDEHADAVRIMSIHKSKGLEFPVCFVSGLAKRFNLQDTTRPVIMDMDYGVAVDYVDPEMRIKGMTLKKSVLAGKLVRDSMGEELRVLYVAMTRAREKLILTGTCKETRVPSGENRPAVMESGRLPFYIRSGARSYLDWLLPVYEQCGFEVCYMDISDLLQSQVAQESSAEARQSILSLWTRTQSECESVKQQLAMLKEKLDTPYPHENLSRLYTKTTVSELKKARMLETAQEAYELFSEKEVIPYIPRFMSSGDKISGTARGSAYHKVLELFPFEQWDGSITVEEVLDTLVKNGRLTQEYREAVSVQKLAVFLESSLAKRMSAALKCGRLWREQPFVLGLPANILNPEFPAQETVLIQGIIDVYFEENGKLVVADYKTDRITAPQELVNRYRVQLDYYSHALSRLRHMPVKETLLYSFALETQIPVE